MNKKLSVFIGFLLFFGANFMTAQAQNTSIGLRGGLNFAKISGDDVSPDTKSKLGVNFGALLTYSITSNFGITGELNFTGKGYKDGSSDVTVGINYLEIPIYGAYYFGAADASLRPKIFAGPTVGILMTATAKGDDTDLDLKEFYEPLELGAVFGVGVHKRVGDGNWVCIDLRYNLGVTDIIKDNLGTIYLDPSKNNVISLNLAYTFPLGNN